ncbi:MAG: phthalate 4,5-dioxygenase reductase subunit [Subtercola sp.]|nr:phthalate 4,5-dioxygenase reductase subunit [Subtercola sp.]
MNALLNEPEPTQTLIVSRRTQITPEIILLELSSSDGTELPAWHPGAHIDLLLPNDMVRQYSLCGDPADRTTWSIGVFLEPAGRGGSEYIHNQIHEGDRLDTRGPRNHFEYTTPGKTIFIAGGVGITPLMPMAAATIAAGNDFELHYGGRSRSTMAFAEKLVEQYGERVHLVPQDTDGFMDLPGILSTPDSGTVIYCCGPAPLLDAVEKASTGWPEGSLTVERFTPRVIEDALADQEIEVELELSGMTLMVPPGVPIIRVLEDNDIPVVASCYEGTCGSCETFVLAGTPDHRDSVLGDSERAKGDVMMVCVSRALTRNLTLEI